MRKGLSWTVLRGLGNSLPARISIAAPILGHMILFNESIAAILSNLTINNASGAHLNNLYCLYVGLFVMGIASTIYQIRCHRIVKRYFDEEDFVITAGPTMTRRDLHGYLITLERIGHDETSQFDLRLAKQQFEMLGGEPAGDNDAPVRNSILKAYYSALAQSRPISRWCATMLYVVAFGFLAVPSLLTFLNVARRLVVQG